MKRSVRSIPRESSNPAAKARKKASRGNFAALARSYGMPPYIEKNRKNLRYVGPVEKGFAWYWFARYVRLRDFKKYGTCIACNLPKPLEKLQAGHFSAAGSCGVELLMDETNVNGECDTCNAFDNFHLFGYAKNLDLRYGEGTANRLRFAAKTRLRDFSKEEYAEKARFYRAKCEELEPVDIYPSQEERMGE
jgi:hypothetical protein